MEHQLVLSDLQDITQKISKFSFDCEENAAKHYHAQAEEGDLEGMFLYAVLLEQGLGVEQDIEQAMLWYEKSGQNGYIRSYYHLGNIYLLGKNDIIKDVKQAMDYYEKASQDGYDKASYNIGILYQFGDTGIEQDKEIAIQYFKLAGEQGSPEAYINLGNIYRYGIEGKLDKDLKQAIQYYNLALKQQEDSALAKMNLALIYLEGGEEVKQDYNKAVKLLKAADILPQAMFNLGILYEQGKGVKKNLNKAKQYYQKAYECKVEEAQEHYERLKQQSDNKTNCICQIF